MDWAKTTTRRDGKHLCFGIGCLILENWRYASLAFKELRTKYCEPFFIMSSDQKNVISNHWWVMVKETQYKTYLALLNHCWGHNGNLHMTSLQWIRTKMRPRQNGHHFADNIFKFILLYAIFVSNFTEMYSHGWNYEKTTTVYIMACHWTGDKWSA